MTTATMALATTILDDPADFTVIATSPSAMEAGQRSLILWAARKIQAVKGELDVAQDQFDLCVQNKWNTHGWRSQILKQQRRIEFYRKIKMALEAGYYIVPPFPLDIFAIRTKKRTPAAMDSTHYNNHDQPPQVLAPGDGRYVDPRPHRESYSDPEKQRDGTTKNITRYYADKFLDVDFPFKLARAEIREATDKALSLKVFDRLGVMPRTRSPDPIVCGQIIVPGQRLWGRPDSGNAITFFVAWWLDTKTL